MTGRGFSTRKTSTVPPKPKTTRKVTGRSVTLTRVTSYNPQVGQTDSDPWTGAAGVRMEEGMIALSRDLLSRWGGPISYGQTVHFSAPGQDSRCNASYVVTDTMNARFSLRADVFRLSRDRNFSCTNVTMTF